MTVLHAACDADSRVLEASESVWPADRIVIVDDYPIEQASTEQQSPSEVWSELCGLVAWPARARDARSLVVAAGLACGSACLHLAPDLRWPNRPAPTGLRVSASFEPVSVARPGSAVLAAPDHAGVGFLSETDAAEVKRIASAAESRLGKLPNLELSFREVTVADEAVVLPPDDEAKVHAVRNAIRQGIEDVRGAGNVPESADHYRPHVSAAYSNGHQMRPRCAHPCRRCSQVQHGWLCRCITDRDPPRQPCIRVGDAPRGAHRQTLTFTGFPHVHLSKNRISADPVHLPGMLTEHATR